MTDGVGTPININENVDPVSCNGENDGSIMLTVTGFTGGLTFLGDLTAATTTNLEAGDYDVTVIDNIGCRNSATVTVSEPDAITLDETVTDVACTGEATGAISLTASGGNGGFSYDWDPTNSGANISGLTAGSYTVTASDSEGCFTTETYLVSEPPNAFEFVFSCYYTN